MGHASSTACGAAGDLRHRYAELASQIRTRGFNEAAIAAAAQSFTGTPPRPRRYSDAPWALPANAVRVLALPIDDPVLSDAPTRQLADIALRAAENLSRLLPGGTSVWLPAAGTLHSTLFHPGVSPADAKHHAGLESPSVDELHDELRAARKLAHDVSFANLSFTVDRLAMTSSGVLLLLLRPTPVGERTAAAAVPACIESLRATAAALFPRAAVKQTSGLVHVSLLRIVSLPRTAFGNSSVATAIGDAIERWSRRLQGRRATMRGLLYVRETQIMTLEGNWYRLPFGNGARRLQQIGWLPRGHGLGRNYRANSMSRHQHAATLKPLREVLADGGTRPGYDLDREDDG